MATGEEGLARRTDECVEIEQLAAAARGYGTMAQRLTSMGGSAWG